jgi:hypothetical protein
MASSKGETAARDTDIGFAARMAALIPPRKKRRPIIVGSYF